MTPYQIERRKVIIKYLDKFPDAPTRLLARILVRDEPEYFKDIEYARDILRVYRGQQGPRGRKTMKFNKYFKHEL
jgi:hypothetical protein